MIPGKLDKELISQPELWRLVLMVSPESLYVALYPPVAREEIMWREFRFDAAAPSPLKALEDIIYDNPLLLCDFRQVDCILDTPEYLFVPADTPSDDYELLLSAVKPDAASAEVLPQPAGPDAMMLQSLQPDIIAFLKRTFYNITFRSRLSLLVNYFSAPQRELTERRAVALIDGQRLTLLAFDGRRMLAANDFSFSTAADAAYYVMASLQRLRFDTSDPSFTLAIHGQSMTADGTLAAILRPYVTNIRAVPFPSLRYRASKSTLQAPFPLLIAPLCE